MYKKSWPLIHYEMDKISWTNCSMQNNYTKQSTEQISLYLNCYQISSEYHSN